MRYFPEEKLVWRTRDDTLVLTTHRIRWKYARWGHYYMTSIMLEEVDSCELHYVSAPGLVGLAVFAMILGILGVILADNVWAGVLGEGVALVSIGLFMMTRKMILSISSKSASIALNVVDLGIEGSVDLIDKIEAMKNRLHIHKNKVGGLVQK